MHVSVCIFIVILSCLLVLVILGGWNWGSAFLMRCKVGYIYEQIITEICIICLFDIHYMYNKLNDADIRAFKDSNVPYRYNNLWIHTSLWQQSSLNRLVLISGKSCAQGGTCSTHAGGSDGASFCEPKKIHEPEILHPKKYLASKFSTQKNTRLSTSILIYSIKQTLRPKKIHDRSLDPKKYRRCKFSTQKNTSELPIMYTASTPPGIMWCRCEYQ